MALFVLPFVAPIYRVQFDVATTVTVVSLFFAILVGFFIAGATSNYLRLQTLIATEDGCLLAIYNFTKLIAPERLEKVCEAIDQYLIAVVEFDQLEYAAQTRKEMWKIVAETDMVIPENPHELSIYQDLHSTKSQLFAINQEMALVAKPIVSSRHWLILITLALLIGLLLLLLRDGVLLWDLVIGALLVVMYEVLTLVREIDDNTFFASQLMYDPPQAVFEAMGRLHYYPEVATKLGILKNEKRPYRLGYTKKTKRGSEKAIKIVK